MSPRLPGIPNEKIDKWPFIEKSYGAAHRIWTQILSVQIT